MAMLLPIHPDNPQSRNLDKVVESLKAGGIVIFPTDTVYALGCDLTQRKAAEKIAAIKGVKIEKANFSFIFNNLSHISEYTAQFDTRTYKLLNRAFPGPFTFILNASNKVPKLFKNKKKTVGIRVPDNSIIQAMAKELGNPILTTSIHDEDEILEYTTDPELIYEKYKDKVDIVIDGGFGRNVPSTVIDFTDDEPELVRQGLGNLEDLI